MILLENTRFYKMEEKNDKDFSKQLAAPYDMSVSLSSVSLSLSRARASPYDMSVPEVKHALKELHRFPPLSL